jgi:murein DD-endopeptidase MepM/ murein hydrolase activator NlpD
LFFPIPIRTTGSPFPRLMGVFLLLGFLSVLFSNPAGAKVYGYIESNGVTHFTDQPIPDREPDQIIEVESSEWNHTPAGKIIQALRERNRPLAATTSKGCSARRGCSGETPSLTDQLFKPIPKGTQLPIAGRLTSTPGQRRDPFNGSTRWHHGADIAVPIGTPIPTIASGEVVFVGEHGGYGQIVVVDHGEAMSLYAHLDRSVVHQGEHLFAQQTIAYSGNSGRSTGPHLHFELWENGRNVTQRVINATPIAERTRTIEPPSSEPIRFVRQADGSLLLTNQPANSER